MQSRRVGAVINIGALWALTWGIGGVLLGIDRILFITPKLPAGISQHIRYLVLNGALFGACGLVAGTSFAAMLARGERAKSLNSLSALRVATWGFLGGGLAGVLSFRLYGAADPSFLMLGAATVGILSSLFAVGTLRLAQSESPTSL